MLHWIGAVMPWFTDLGKVLTLEQQLSHSSMVSYTTCNWLVMTFHLNMAENETTNKIPRFQILS